MTTTNKSRADALTPEQIKSECIGFATYFDGSLYTYDEAAIIKLAQAFLAASPVEQPIAASGGYCERAGGCVCGGDLPRVREGCSGWVKAEAEPATRDAIDRRHVGDSKFEGWYANYVAKGEANPKQIARDAYAAGMGDMTPQPATLDERSAFVEAYLLSLPPEDREVNPAAVCQFAESVIEANGPSWQIWRRGIAYARTANTRPEYRCVVPNYMCNGIGGAMSHHVSRGVSHHAVIGIDSSGAHTHCNHIFEAVPIDAGSEWSRMISQCKWYGLR